MGAATPCYQQLITHWGRPLTLQEKLLFYLSEEVTRTPAVFEQAQRCGGLVLGCGSS